MILGRQMGNDDPRELTARVYSTSTMFRHNVASFTKLWEQVGAETGTTWAVEAEMGDSTGARPGVAGGGWQDAGSRRITFVVRRTMPLNML